jgi:hypothetical protein
VSGKTGVVCSAAAEDVIIIRRNKPDLEPFPNRSIPSTQRTM